MRGDALGLVEVPQFDEQRALHARDLSSPAIEEGTVLTIDSTRGSGARVELTIDEEPHV